MANFTAPISPSPPTGSQPLASDTPSSNFARHPILGAIVWLFGGKEDQDQKLSKNLTGSTINNSSEDSLSGHSSGGEWGLGGHIQPIN